MKEQNSKQVINISKDMKEAEAKAIKSVNRFFQRMTMNLGKTFRNMLIFAVGMTVLQHFVPEAREFFPGVYSYLDNIILPVINWAYAFATKVYSMFADMPVIKTIIEAFADFVA